MRLEIEFLDRQRYRNAYNYYLSNREYKIIEYIQ